MLSMEDQEKIRRFLYRNARPLDLARWQYHFEKGDQEPVLAALVAYQNEDGGFGSALEADAWNPESSPIQTSTAAAVLEEINFDEKAHPLVFGLLEYLDSGKDFQDGRWMNVILSNNGYPHAPWWESGSQSTSHSPYNPSAILAGFALYFAPGNTVLFGRCKAMAREMADAFLQAPALDMHPLMCVRDLIGWIRRANLTSAFPVSAMEEALLGQAARLISSDRDKWGGYACLPSRFINGRNHPLYNELKELVEKELDYLEATRNDQGVWDISWRWAGYEKAFAISENWWKADVALRNLQFLKAFGRLADVTP